MYARLTKYVNYNIRGTHTVILPYDAGFWLLLIVIPLITPSS
jgi:hypothetical protein